MTGIELVKQVKSLVFKHPYAFPGGYEHALYMVDGERLCRDCALDNWASIVAETLHPGGGDPGWGILGVDIYWEGPPEHCAHCGKEMASEYGDPQYDEQDLE